MELRRTLACAALTGGLVMGLGACGGEAGGGEPVAGGGEEAENLSDALIVGATATARIIPNGRMLLRINASPATAANSSNRIVAWEVWQHQMGARSLSAGIIVVGVTKARKVLTATQLRQGNSLSTVVRGGVNVAVATGQGMKHDATTGMTKTARQRKLVTDATLKGVSLAKATQALQAANADFAWFRSTTPLGFDWNTAPPETRRAFLLGVGEMIGGFLLALAVEGMPQPGVLMMAVGWDRIQSVGGLPDNFFGNRNPTYTAPANGVTMGLAPTWINYYPGVNPPDCAFGTPNCV